MIHPVAAYNSVGLSLDVNYAFAIAAVNGDLPDPLSGLAGVQRSMVDDVLYTFSSPDKSNRDSRPLRGTKTGHPCGRETWIKRKMNALGRVNKEGEG